MGRGGKMGKEGNVRVQYRASAQQTVGGRAGI